MPQGGEGVSVKEPGEAPPLVMKRGAATQASSTTQIHLTRRSVLPITTPPHGSGQMRDSERDAMAPGKLQ